MTNTKTKLPTVPTIPEPGPTVPARHHARARPLRIGTKLKSALDRMVFGDENGDPLSWDAAARSVRFPVRSMRKALERAHVQRYLKQQKQVFRASLSASNLLHADKMRRESTNEMARLGAIKFIEQEAADEANQAQQQAPGMTIVVLQQAPPQIAPRQTITVAPEPARDDETD